MPVSQQNWILSGSQLSPYHLKVAAILKFKGIPYEDFPSEGGFFANLRVSRRVSKIKAKRLPLTAPEFTPLDEFPLVPFLLGPNGENLYDSSAIALWLDQNIKPNSNQTANNVVEVSSDQSINFLVQLIDEYFDEYGLYMVHHARWKMSAQDNDAGKRLGNELASLIGPLKHILAKSFSVRQIRRLPYLFSVAPKEFNLKNLPNNRQPPTREGFAATHALLETSYLNILHALEPIFATRPFLLGNHFTLADASLYGQLGMNLSDPSAANWIKNTAPNLYRWLNNIHQGNFLHNKKQDKVTVQLDELLRPLINEITRVYYPLMQQNERAYEQHKKQGETVFNEKAFNKGRALYEGKIDGAPFKHVVKTFQVKTWRKIIQLWQQLNSTEQAKLLALYPTINPTQTLVKKLNTAGL